MAEIPKEALKFKGPTREKVRRAAARVLECEETRSSTKAISVAKLRGAGCGDQNAATELLRLWRSGALSIVDSWDDPAPASTGSADEPADPSSLGALVRAAKSDGDREELLHELAALVADGKVAPDEAAQIRAALAEARQAADAKRANEPPPEDPSKLRLASIEAMNAAAALDMMVDDARRDRLLALIAAELEADRVQHPNEDEGGA